MNYDAPLLYQKNRDGKLLVVCVLFLDKRAFYFLPTNHALQAKTHDQWLKLWPYHSKDHAHQNNLKVYQNIFQLKNHCWDYKLCFSRQFFLNTLSNLFFTVPEKKELR